MDRTLQKILRKVESVQLGLLRCSEDDQKLLLQARAGMDDTNLNCIVNRDSSDVSLISKNVSLIQRHKEDYLYISCRVTDEVVKNSATIISMEVLKACWFTRKSKGSVSWLKEKYIYQAIGGEIDMAS
jgi:hypothetical protein